MENSDQDSTVVNCLRADCTTCVLHGDAIISRSDFIAGSLLLIVAYHASNSGIGPILYCVQTFYKII